MGKVTGLGSNQGEKKENRDNGKTPQLNDGSMAETLHAKSGNDSKDSVSLQNDSDAFDFNPNHDQIIVRNSKTAIDSNIHTSHTPDFRNTPDSNIEVGIVSQTPLELFTNSQNNDPGIQTEQTTYRPILDGLPTIVKTATESDANVNSTQSKITTNTEVAMTNIKSILSSH